MIYIAINVVFNAFMLFLVFVIGSAFSSHHAPTWLLWDIAFAISAVLAIIGYTRLATFIVGIFIPGRKAVGREINRIQPLLENAIEQANKNYGTNYNIRDFKIKISDSKIADAAALGHNLIIVSRGALNTFNDEELRAVIAHELGHLFYGDSIRNIALIFSAFATRVVMWFYAVYASVTAMLNQVFSSAKGEAAAALTLGSLIPLLIFLPVVLLNLLGTKVFDLLNMMMSRSVEYRADAFASSLGYKADMIAALETLDGLTITDNSFLAKLMATHPAPMQRIGALEDEAVAKKKMGRLFVARPMALNGKNVGGSSELLRLIIVLIIAGGLWAACVYQDMTQPNHPATHHKVKHPKLN